MEIQYFLTKVNYTYMSNKKNEYIVIHYTGNKGDTAKNNCNYFYDTNRGASANYFVDEDNIYCCVKPTDKAWHCGGGMQSSSGGAYYQKCTNSNSIGIEMCLLDKNGKERKSTIENTIKLVRWLMDTYHIPVGKVIRHWDVVGKECPGGWTGNNNINWKAFKQSLSQESEDELMSKEYEELKGIISKQSEEISELSEIISKRLGYYNYIDSNMSDSYKPTIKKLVDNGLLKGNYNGELMLTEDMMRMLTILDRAGVFD